MSASAAVLCVLLAISAAAAAPAGAQEPFPYDPEPFPAPGEPLPPSPAPPRGVGPAPADPGSAYPRFSVDAFYWHARYRGKVERERDGAGNDIHPREGSFGLDFPAPMPAFRARFELDDRFSIGADYEIGDFEGRGVVAGGFAFDGVSFASGTPIKTRLQLEGGSAEVGWGYAGSERVRAGLLVGAGWFEERLRLRDRATGATADTAVSQFAPMVGQTLRISFLDGFGIDAHARLFAWAERRKRFGAWDFEALLYVEPVPWLRISLGVRHVAVDNHARDSDGEVVGDFDLQSIVGGIGFRF